MEKTGPRYEFHVDGSGCIEWDTPQELAAVDMKLAVFVAEVAKRIQDNFSEQTTAAHA